VNKTKIFSTLLIFIFTASIIFAQGELGERALADIESSMEANLTWNLQNALLLYYPETKFVVKANVELQKVKLKRELPKLPDALLSKELKNLPGLPYIPENLGGSQAAEANTANLRDELQANRYDVRRIRLNVLVDRSLSENDMSFIRRYVTLIADLNPKRGDRVRIEAFTFPVKANFMKDEEKTPELPFQPEVEPANTAIDWKPYAFAAGLALLLLLFFLIGLRSVVKNLKKNSVVAVAAKSEATPESENHKDFNLEGEETSSRDLASLKSSLIDTIVGLPAASAKVFHRWIDNKGNEGVTDVAILLASVSKPLIELVAPYLGQETTENIQHQIAVLEETDLQEKSPGLLKQFDEDMRTLALKTSKDAAENDELAFLNQMTDDQVQHLIKPLKVGIVAIVLAHLRANRAAKVLSKLEPDRRKAVLAAMGNIERIPSDVYQHLARQLAVRAGELKKMRYVRANGFDSLVKVMEHLDEDTQDEMINYLHTQDVNLAQKVSETFMTFNQLFEMPEEKLAEMAVDFDREALAKSLVSVDEETVEKMINSLPEKLGELVRASLDANLDISEDEISKARRNLMRSVRAKHS
ncbi:hypothetical protein IH824_04475, partial [candidate division KSB1 bacterium]|nr:hypothetical protein [candidate division KSB1 bacterium]